MRFVGCELEPRFVALANQNFNLHRQDWEAMGRPIPVIVQGDSRQLRQHVGPVLAECVLSSPPYARSDQDYARGRRSIDWEKGARAGMKNDRISGPEASYGDAPGQLAAMPEGGVEAVISSPPYAEIASGAGGLNTKPARHEGEQAGRSATAASQDTDQRYGESEGQLARLPKGDVDAIVASPPFADSLTPGNRDNSREHRQDLAVAAGHVRVGGGQLAYANRYSDDPGNLGNLPSGAVDAVVSSPPFTQGYSGGGGINVKGYGPDGADKVGSRTYQGTGGERADGNLETLTLGKVEAVVGSPPWGDGADGAEDGPVEDCPS